MSTFGTFFLPGPTEVRPEVLAAMTGPMLPHRGAAFETLFGRVLCGLSGVFRTARPVFVSSSSATGLMEAGIRCAPAGRVLSLVNGAFSERYAQISRGCARETDVLSVPVGQTFDLDAVRTQLRKARYAVVTVVHSETSTGVLTDARAITQLAREHGAVCLVDSVTGIAGTPLEFDAWEMDYVLTGSQKALALPPGLGFAAASADFMAKAAHTTDRGMYFDLVEFEAYAKKRQTPNTPALSLLYALDVQLAAIEREGIAARWARHDAMTRQTHAWVAELAAATGFAIDVLAPLGARSTTVTAVKMPDGVSSEHVVSGAAARGFVIGSGYGALKSSTFRIGHMGDHTPEGLARCLAACGDALKALT
jgi:aspartate aminotransferase-like enzyme